MNVEELEFRPVRPVDFLNLIESENSFLQRSGLNPAAGLRSFIVSDDVSNDFVDQLQQHANAPADPWCWGFFVLDPESNQVIGNAGFKGPPGENGTVEVAYGIVPSFEGNGCATRALGHLVEFAKRYPEVKRILAHTLPERNASCRVLEKHRFQQIETIQDPTDGTIWRWQYSGKLGG